MSLASDLIAKWRSVYPDVTKSSVAMAYQAKFAEGAATAVQDYVDPQFNSLRADVATLRTDVNNLMGVVNNLRTAVANLQVVVLGQTNLINQALSSSVINPPLPPTGGGTTTLSGSISGSGGGIQPSGSVTGSQPPITETVTILGFVDPLLAFDWFVGGGPVANVTGGGTFPIGTQITLSVIQLRTDYRFVGWYGSSNNFLSSAQSVTIPATTDNQGVTAKFELITSSVPSGSVTPSGSITGSGGSVGGIGGAINIDRNRLFF